MTQTGRSTTGDTASAVLPEPGSNAWDTLVNALAEETAIKAKKVDHILRAMIDRQTGPRYVAVWDGEADEAGNPGYHVEDRRTGERTGHYTGYFAGQDARRMAALRNSEEG